MQDPLTSKEQWDMKTIVLTGLISVFALSAGAQDTAPIVEVSAQYQLLQADSRPNVPTFTANGGTLGLAVDFFDQLQGVLELGAAYNGSNLNLKNSLLTYLVGPRVSLRNRAKRIIPALEVLVGGATAFGGGTNPITLVHLARNSTGFAMAAGGTLDIRLNHRIAFRPVQVDYLLTNVDQGRVQNNFRYSAGLVFTFGSQE
jgi:hypothetical protein